MFDISFSSRHPGGCHMARCDGSSAFVSETIDIKTWRALASRAGDEPIGTVPQ
jgi:prepilin-type processing-associated H-X9-DG protein